MACWYSAPGREQQAPSCQPIHEFPSTKAASPSTSKLASGMTHLYMQECIDNSSGVEQSFCRHGAARAAGPARRDTCHGVDRRAPGQRQHVSYISTALLWQKPACLLGCGFELDCLVTHGAAQAAFLHVVEKSLLKTHGNPCKNPEALSPRPLQAASHGRKE